MFLRQQLGNNSERNGIGRRRGTIAGAASKVGPSFANLEKLTVSANQISTCIRERRKAANEAHDGSLSGRQR